MMLVNLLLLIELILATVFALVLGFKDSIDIMGQLFLYEMLLRRKCGVRPCLLRLKVPCGIA